MRVQRGSREGVTDAWVENTDSELAAGSEVEKIGRGYWRKTVCQAEKLALEGAINTPKLPSLKTGSGSDTSLNKC